MTTIDATSPRACPDCDLHNKPLIDETGTAEDVLRDLHRAVHLMLATLNARIAPMRAALRNAGVLS